jgi:hypothetical protein
MQTAKCNTLITSALNAFLTIIRLCQTVLATQIRQILKLHSIAMFADKICRLFPTSLPAMTIREASVYSVLVDSIISTYPTLPLARLASRIATLKIAKDRASFAAEDSSCEATFACQESFPIACTTLLIFNVNNARMDLLQSRRTQQVFAIKDAITTA